MKTEPDSELFEALIASAIVDVAREIRLVDLADLCVLVRSGHWENIEDLLASSTELYFVDGALRFGLAADVSMDWNKPARIMFGFEFRHAGITAFFTMILSECDLVVNLSRIQFPAVPVPQHRKPDMLRNALDAARLLPPVSAGQPETRVTS